MSTVKADVKEGLKIVELSSSEILNSNTTPIQLLSAPGSGYMHIITSAAVILRFGTTSYASGGPLYIYFGTDQGNPWFTFGTNAIISGNNSVSVPTAQQITGDNLTHLDNQAVNIYSSSANPTTGDGTLVVVLKYITVPTS